MFLKSSVNDKKKTHYYLPFVFLDLKSVLMLLFFFVCGRCLTKIYKTDFFFWKALTVFKPPWQKCGILTQRCIYNFQERMFEKKKQNKKASHILIVILVTKTYFLFFLKQVNYLMNISKESVSNVTFSPSKWFGINNFTTK